MPIEAVIYLKRYDLKNVKQVLRRPTTLLVTLYCLTTGLTYDRAGFTYKSLRNHVQKILCIFLKGGAYTPYAPYRSSVYATSYVAVRPPRFKSRVLQLVGSDGLISTYSEINISDRYRACPLKSVTGH